MAPVGSLPTDMDPLQEGALVTVRTRKVDSLLYLCKGIVTTVYHPDVSTVAVHIFGKATPTIMARLDITREPIECDDRVLIDPAMNESYTLSSDGRQSFLQFDLDWRWLQSLADAPLGVVLLRRFENLPRLIELLMKHRGMKLIIDSHIAAGVLEPGAPKPASDAFPMQTDVMAFRVMHPSVERALVRALRMLFRSGPRDVCNENERIRFNIDSNHSTFIAVVTSFGGDGGRPYGLHVLEHTQHRTCTMHLFQDPLYKNDDTETTGAGPSRPPQPLKPSTESSDDDYENAGAFTVADAKERMDRLSLIYRKDGYAAVVVAAKAMMHASTGVIISDEDAQALARSVVGYCACLDNDEDSDGIEEEAGLEYVD